MSIGFHLRQRDINEIRRKSPEGRARLFMAMGVVLTFITSILLLAGTTYAPKDCTRGVFLWPLIAIGLFLMVIFALGMCGGTNKDEDLLSCYCIGLFIVILALLGFVIFGYVAVGGIDLNPVKTHEYNLKDYKSGWLRGRVADPHYWARASACLRDKGKCKGMSQLIRDPESGIFVPELSKWDRWAKRRGMDGWHIMSPIESGCCKPPSSCGFTYVNGTTWTPTPGAPAAVATNINDDCSKWSNDQETLCFQCDSCKAGFLDDTRKAWSSTAFFPVFTLFGAILSCWTGASGWLRGHMADPHYWATTSRCLHDKNICNSMTQLLLYGCYFIGLLIVIPTLLGFVIFSYVAVGGIDIGGVRVHEYNLDDCSGWLRGHVANPHYWATTSRCLHDKNIYNGMT
ncbi:hypothetical protein E2562_009223 [Oryza meyeriana var. granulata]|uniref:Tetraspanin n=1 Tax=Oryza meyeriana var. granulata TaxID=110450 RepID=A0A6G1D191_9ORYZ|nr:hypothetical protein E2562_009223 [Oryza meyeriana var. granulata]